MSITRRPTVATAGGWALSRRVAELIVAMVATLVSAACGTSQSNSVAGLAPASPSAAASAVSSASAASPSNAVNTLYVLSSENGSQVGGTVQVRNGSAGTTLTVSLKGLSPGVSYLADADPLPCEIFVGGPSQSFATRFTADQSGNATVTWTVPAGMAGNANVQSLTSQGAFVVVACTDLG